MKKRLIIALASLIAGASALAFTALEDNFDSGKGGWIRRGSTNNEGGVDWLTGYPTINLNTNSGQPHSIYHDIGSIALSDGDTLRLTVDVKKAHTNESPTSLKVGFGYADAVFGDAQQATVPVDGYALRMPSGGSVTNPVVDWVDKDIDGDGSTVNFFNKSTEALGELALDHVVSIGTNFTTVVFEITRMDTNLVFSGSIGGSAFSNAVATTHGTNTLAGYEFNTVGLAHAYETGLGNASFDNLRVELNPNDEIVELFSTSFDGATQPGGFNAPINMAGTLDGVAVSTLDPGTGASTGDTYLLKATDISASAHMYVTNYASTAAPRLGDGTGTSDSTNLASAIATDSYVEFTVDSGKVAYDSLNFKMVKFGYAQNAGVTVRSSVDGYTGDLATFENDVIQGAYAVAVDLSSVAGLDSATNVTFRFYLYNEYPETASNRKLGIDDIRLTGIPLAKTLFATDFESSSQPGGNDTPINMGGTMHSNVTVGTLVNGTGVNTFRIDNQPTSDGQFASEAVGNNPSTTLAEAIVNDEYFEFAVTSSIPVDVEMFSFNMVKHGFAPLAGITLRSSLDGFTSDLVTVTDASSQGVYPAAADLSSNEDFQDFTSATFRFYLYDEFTPQDNRRLGVDNIQITGIYAGEVTPAELTIVAGSGTVTISAVNLSATADYQLQSRTGLTSDGWGDVGSAVTGVTSHDWVVTPSNPAVFYQVEGSN